MPGPGRADGESLRKPARTDGERGDRSNGDGGAEPHDEGRGDTGPEQSLRQRKNQNQDRPGTGAKADGDDGGQSTLPAAGTGKFLRLGRMRMAPGRSMVVVIVSVMMTAASGAVLVVVAVRRMRVSMAGVSMACVIMMGVAAVIMRMGVTMRMRVSIGVRMGVSVRVRGVAMGMRVTMSMSVAVRRLMTGTIFPPRVDKRPPLDPEKPRAQHRDQPIADHLDPAHRLVHRACSGAEQHRGDAHDRDCDQRLQNRGGKRQRNAAPPGLAIGDDVRRNHRLAVTGAGGMKDAIGEGQREQCPDRAAILLGRTDRCRQTAIEFGLLGEQPADDTVGRRRGGARRTERIALRESRRR